MTKSEFDIRLARVSEQPSRCNFNRWELLKYDKSPIDVKLCTSLIPYIEKDVLRVVLGVHYDTTRKSIPRNLLQYFIALDFEIVNLKDYISVTDKEVKLPSYMLTMLMSIGIGTMRGMLVQKTRHTFLDDMPLPIINITEIVAYINSSTSHNKSIPILQFVYE